MRSFIIFSVILVISSSLAFAEELTMTTYYPAPSGKYQELSVAGNVGIGTTASQGNFVVRLDNTGISRILNLYNADRTDNNSAGISFRTDTFSESSGTVSSSQELARIRAMFLMHSTGTPTTRIKGGLSFDVRSADIWSSVVIDPNGNVGIGTTVPTGKLEVINHSVDFLSPTGAGLLISDIFPTAADIYGRRYYPGIGWRTTDNNPDKLKAAIYMGINTPVSPPFVSGDLGSSLYFSTTSDFTAGIWNPAMVIGPTGNVGIGVASYLDKAKLDVFGEVRVDASEDGLADFAVRNDGSTRAYMIGSDFISVGSTGIWTPSTGVTGEINVDNKVLINDGGITLKSGATLGAAVAQNGNICLEPTSCVASATLASCPHGQPFMTGYNPATSVSGRFCCDIRLRTCE